VRTNLKTYSPNPNITTQKNKWLKSSNHICEITGLELGTFTMYRKEPVNKEILKHKKPNI